MPKHLLYTYAYAGNKQEFIHLGTSLDPLQELQGYLQTWENEDQKLTAKQMVDRAAGYLKLRMAAICAVQTAQMKDKAMGVASVPATIYWATMEDILETMKLKEQRQAQENEPGPVSQVAQEELQDLQEDLEKKLMERVKKDTKRLTVASSTKPTTTAKPLPPPPPPLQPRRQGQFAPRGGRSFYRGSPRGGRGRYGGGRWS